MGQGQVAGQDPHGRRQCLPKNDDRRRAGRATSGNQGSRPMIVWSIRVNAR